MNGEDIEIIRKTSLCILIKLAAYVTKGLDLQKYKRRLLARWDYSFIGA